LKKRDTVAVDTPALAATSLIVALLIAGRPDGVAIGNVGPFLSRLLFPVIPLPKCRNGVCGQCRRTGAANVNKE